MHFLAHKALSPRSRDHLNKGWKENAVSVASLLSSIQALIEAKRARGDLYGFMFFMLVITVHLFVNQAVVDRDHFDLSSSVLRRLNSDIFLEVNDKHEYWNWLEGATNNIWNDFLTVPQEENSQKVRPGLIPVAAVLLRQWRGNIVQCPPIAGLNVFPQKIRTQIQKLDRCTSSSDEFDTTPFGPNGMWKVTQDSKFKVHSTKVAGALHAYTNSSEAFVHPLFSSDKLEDVQRELLELKENDWFDYGTRSIVTELLMYSQSSELYVHTFFILETTARGNCVGKVETIVFSLRSFHFKELFILFLEVVMSFYIISAFQRLLRVRRMRQEIFTKSVFMTFDEAYTLLYLLLLSVTFSFRTRSLIDSMGLRASSFMNDNLIYIQKMHGGNEVLFVYDMFAKFAEFEQRTRTLVGLCHFLGWCRVLLFLRKNDRLNALIKTLEQAAGQLIGMGVIMGILHLGFGAIAFLFYGDKEEQFRSFFGSIGALLRVLIGCFDMWDEMKAIHPICTPILIFCYFFVCWLVMLNLVVGIVGRSFSTVQQSAEEPDWNPVHILKDLVKFFKLVQKNESKTSESSQKVPQLQLLAEIFVELKQLSCWAYLTRDEFDDFLPPQVSQIEGDNVYRLGKSDVNERESTNQMMGRALATMDTTVDVIGRRVESNKRMLSELVDGQTISMRTSLIHSIGENNLLGNELEKVLNSIVAELPQVKADVLQFETDVIRPKSAKIEERYKSLEFRASRIERLLNEVSGAVSNLGSLLS